MASTKSKEWTRAIMCRPRDNLTTEAGLRAQHHVMVSRLDQECLPDSMSMLIGMEYARIWLKDRDLFQKKRNDSKAKFIHNDFDWWLKLRKTNKCFCTI
ncbi:uncharacterized protein LOC111594191 [Drosophila hydei]|uniref:Uncharacterized protein LOC111594191 n=1 Tax=Drosophila hydei TaxID=7224 RepID=A0A6J1LAX4_DROHY|nr:uncharacterized protein LOC111594191 [Drosophila hydei]